MKKLLEKLTGIHNHKFVFVENVGFEPMFENSMYAKYTTLWRCECGAEKTFTEISLI